MVRETTLCAFYIYIYVCIISYNDFLFAHCLRPTFKDLTIQVFPLEVTTWMYIYIYRERERGILKNKVIQGEESYMKESWCYNVSVSTNHLQDLENMLWMKCHLIRFTSLRIFPPNTPHFLTFSLFSLKLCQNQQHRLRPLNPRSISPSFLFCLLSLDPTFFHIHIYTLLFISSFAKQRIHGKQNKNDVGRNLSSWGS